MNIIYMSEEGDASPARRCVWQADDSIPPPTVRKNRRGLFTHVRYVTPKKIW